MMLACNPIYRGYGPHFCEHSMNAQIDSSVSPVDAAI